MMLPARDPPCPAPNRPKGSPPSTDAIWQCPTTGGHLTSLVFVVMAPSPSIPRRELRFVNNSFIRTVSLSSPSHGAVRHLQVATDQNPPRHSIFLPHRRHTSPVSPRCREFAGHTSRTSLMLSPSNLGRLVGWLTTGACAATQTMRIVTVPVRRRVRTEGMHAWAGRAAQLGLWPLG
jgi:hypothetical protein